MPLKANVEQIQKPETYRHLTGKPDAMKVACPVWEGEDGNLLTKTSKALSSYFIHKADALWSLRSCAVLGHFWDILQHFW